ncbi:TIGR04140 family protein [Thermococcus celer]|uniref:TIGR04140 family protein n=1 Tax=Thermococcus celer Vu 13 = JCM 8558 TaxID=1293037 RepID=A0A218P344_THECE|nr:TIGR04140 family protein [Thermococcus celer]ASI99344.1 TIGR04140 family protein [Thermococcus celer Vu 13 = JCM 8558]
MKREILTPIPLDELEGIREGSGAVVTLTLLGKVERNGIPLNIVQIEGEAGEIERFMERLRMARAGG